MGLKVNYKGSQLTSMDETGTKTLLTNGKYCEDNFEVVYEGSGSSGYTATVNMEDKKTGGPITYASCNIKYNNQYKSSNFNYEANDTLTFTVYGGDHAYSYLYINGSLVASAFDSMSSQKYNYTLPNNNIQIKGYYVQRGASDDYYTYVTVGLEISEYGSYIADSSVPYDLVTITSSEPTDAVRFFDYDGTILYSYSKTQFLALSSMPANPSHTGLTAQGWNWSLSDAKAHVQNWNFLDIGQMYITSDGTTQIDIELHKGYLDPYLEIAVNGTVRVNWGDGSSVSTITGTTLTTPVITQHIYAQEGNYTIKITVTSGSFAFGADSSNRLLTSNSDTSAQNIIYTNAVKKIRIGNNCSIGNYAFAFCYSLSSITIPSSVTSIGTYAFRNCYHLSSITIPPSITSIEDYTFTDCCNLSSVTIPSSVTSIGNYSFQYCYSLTSITIPSSVTSIGNYVFSNCYNLSKKIIPLYNIIYANNFNHIEVSSTATSIGQYAFYKCRSLSSVTIPSSITSIGTYAFSYCSNLSSITIPSTVTSIGYCTFGYCNSLSSITIPSSVTSIGEQAFQYCHSLSSITIPSGVTSIESYLFSYCYSLSSVTIPSSITSIGSNAFQDCRSLSSVIIPSGITSTGSNTFDGCYSLSSVTIPSSITSIGTYAFRNCYCLSSIIIPSNVTSIGNSAFNGCSGISEYHIQATTPPTLGTNVFTGIRPNCKIYVPSASLSTYQSATNWSTYASYMVGE